MLCCYCCFFVFFFSVVTGVLEWGGSGRKGALRRRRGARQTNAATPSAPPCTPPRHATPRSAPSRPAPPRGLQRLGPPPVHKVESLPGPAGASRPRPSPDARLIHLPAVVACCRAGQTFKFGAACRTPTKTTTQTAAAGRSPLQGGQPRRYPSLTRCQGPACRPNVLLPPKHKLFCCNGKLAASPLEVPVCSSILTQTAL